MQFTYVDVDLNLNVNSTLDVALNPTQLAMEAAAAALDNKSKVVLTFKFTLSERALGLADGPPPIVCPARGRLAE